MRTRKPTGVHFPVPNLGFQTDNFFDTLIADLEDDPEYDESIDPPEGEHDDPRRTGPTANSGEGGT
jgi:hypothetical protein